MKVYRIMSSSYRGYKVIANNVSDAINKYLLDSKDIEHKLNSIIKVEYLENFDYIQ